MPSTIRSFRLGVFWSLLSALLWSTTFVSGRYLIGRHQVDPVTLSLLRYAVGGVVLLGFGLWRYRQEILAVKIRDILILSALALSGLVGMSVLLFLGQQSTTAINSSLIMQLNPVLMLLLGVFVGERLHWRNATGIMISLTGTLFVIDIIGPRGFALSLGRGSGDFMVLAAATCWAVYSVLNKPAVNRLGGYACTMWAMLAAAAELAAIQGLLPVPIQWPQGAFNWCLILYLAIFPTAVAFFAWCEAMNHINLSLLSVMQYLTPAFTILLAWFFLGEGMTPWQWIGVGIVAAGITLVSTHQTRKIHPTTPAKTPPTATPAVPAKATSQDPLPTQSRS
ncbi:MAG: DMT family transporter [Verrucomicrobiae bacterium]|nr:DMT family transporter [Verrucomicrobiae bacterium]